MSKKIYLFSLVLLALAFVSCSETEEVGKYDNWRARNEAFIDSLANVYATAADKDLKRTEMLTAPGNYIYHKVMPSMTDHVVKAGNPKYTDKLLHPGKHCQSNHLRDTLHHRKIQQPDLV